MTRLKNSLITSLYFMLFTLQNSNVITWVDVVAFVVDNTAFVDIDTRISISRFVEQLIGERIELAFGNIVEGKENDILRLESLRKESVISMTNIRLMSVIAETIRTSN